MTRAIANIAALAVTLVLFAYVGCWISERIPHARNGCDLEFLLASAPR